MPLQISIDKRPDLWIVDLHGDLDYNECAPLRMTIDKVLKSMPEATVLNLTDVPYIDSSGLGLLLALSKEYRSQGGRLVLVTNEVAENILDLTRLSPLFVRAASLDEALGLART